MLMENKKGLVMGLANDHSIAWGIAKALDGAGAKIAISYQGEALKKRVEPLCQQLKGETMLIECDVSNTNSVENCFKTIAQRWGKIDFLVHAIAFSDKDQLKGKTIDTTLDNFLHTMHISCYSFLEACRCAAPILNQDAAVLTLTYLGAEKYVPNYNIMGVAKAALEASVRYAAADLGLQGVRVNAISAGPIKTLAAAGIGDFKKILRYNELNTPLRRNVSQDDVGAMALALLSDLGRGVTGEIVHVDAGFHQNAMFNLDKAKELAEILEQF
ncbi:MAG: enoyl-ACP reductase [Alphaproteobacteria bacterium]|nr:enoyl-ACP reductase [Alphaproteobacteria bacterium]